MEKVEYYKEYNHFLFIFSSKDHAKDFFNGNLYLNRYQLLYSVVGFFMQLNRKLAYLPIVGRKGKATATSKDGKFNFNCFRENLIEENF